MLGWHMQFRKEFGYTPGPVMGLLECCREEVEAILPSEIWPSALIYSDSQKVGTWT